MWQGIAGGSHIAQTNSSNLNSEEANLVHVDRDTLAETH